MQAGEQFSQPPLVVSCDFQAGALPPELSLIAVEPANVRNGRAQNRRKMARG
jgi:hypothetical protein